MWKKMLLLLSLFAFTVTVAIPADVADARKSFSSGKRSYTKTPSKAQDNVSKSTTGTTKSGAAAGSTTPKRGFTSGGGFMKGMMIGGLAGLMFGGMFGNMGFFGDIMGLLVNLAAIFFLVVIIMGVVNAIRRRKQPRPQGPNDSNRRW